MYGISRGINNTLNSAAYGTQCIGACACEVLRDGLESGAGFWREGVEVLGAVHGKRVSVSDGGYMYVRGLMGVHEPESLGLGFELVLLGAGEEVEVDDGVFG